MTLWQFEAEHFGASHFKTWYAGAAVAPSPTLTLRDLFCGRNFAVEADVLAFIEDFNNIIADNSILSDADQEYLLSMGGLLEEGDRFTVLDAYVRDWWLDRWIWFHRGAPTPENPRAWGSATPTTFNESDPLGIATGTNDIIIDGNNLSAHYVKPTTNELWNYNGTVNTGQLLWLTATDSTYQSRLWSTPESMLEGNSINRRRFPYDGSAVRVYIRGGVYDIAKTIGLGKMNPAATHNSRIEIVAYPGEWVQWNCSSPPSGTDFDDSKYAFAIVQGSSPDPGGRKNVWLRNIFIQPWRDNVVVSGVGTGRVYCPKVIGINGGAQTGDFSGCRLDNVRIANARAISPGHPLKDSVPEFVDLAFTKRINMTSTASTAKMLDACGVKLGAGANNCVITDMTMAMGGTNFPLSLKDPTTVPPYVDSDFTALGEGIDFTTGADHLSVYRSNLAGQPSHQSIRVNGGTNLKVRHSTLTAKENTCLGGGGDVRFNRITYYASAVDGDAGDGNGVQFSGEDCILSDNVIWNPQQLSFGLGIVMNANGASGATFKNNTVERNILYGVGMGLRYTSGTLGSTDLITGNTIRQNILVDRPLANLEHSADAYDALISLFIRDSEFSQNTITGNLLYRTDSSNVAITVQQYDGLGGYTYTDLPYSTTQAPFSANVTGDPMFRDPESGDFRLRSGSPVDWLHEDCPLVAFDMVWGAAPYACPVQGGVVEYAVGPSIMRYAPQQTQFGYSVANSRPLYGVQER